MRRFCLPCRLSYRPVVRFHSNAVVHANSFAMSGCGWLIPFYIGVIKAMKDRGVMNEFSTYGGTSSGSLGSLIACCDVKPEDAMRSVLELTTNAAFNRDKNTGLKAVLEPLIDDHSFRACQSRMFITMTKVWPNPNGVVTVVSEFDSKQHLLEVVAASCFIPLYSATQLAVTVGKETDLYVDGGVLAFMPPVGDITISPFPRRFIYELLPVIKPNPKTYRPACIYLDRKDYPLHRLLSWVLIPPPEKEMWGLYHSGIKAANMWMDNNSVSRNRHDVKFPS